MPELTVKALAEFAQKPVLDQMRILAEQKRPNAGAAAFKTNYYQSTRIAIRKFYRNNNDPNVLNDAIIRVHNGSGPEHKRDHNCRAIHSFGENNLLVNRVLLPVAGQVRTRVVEENGVSVRLHPELEALEGGRTKFIIINYTLAPLEDETARRTLELMYWLLREAGEAIGPADCEFIDLQTGVIHINSRQPRARQISNAKQNLQVINRLWPII